MNNKMAVISQLSTIEKNQTKQTNRTGTESQIWRSFRGLSVGRGKGRIGEKVQGLRVQIGRYRIDRGMLRTMQEMEQPKNLYA